MLTNYRCLKKRESGVAWQGGSDWIEDSRFFGEVLNCCEKLMNILGGKKKLTIGKNFSYDINRLTFH